MGNRADCARRERWLAMVHSQRSRDRGRRSGQVHRLATDGFRRRRADGARPAPAYRLLNLVFLSHHCFTNTRVAAPMSRLAPLQTGKFEASLSTPGVVAFPDHFYLVAGTPEFKGAAVTGASSYSAGGPPPPMRPDCVMSFSRMRSAGAIRESSRGRATT